MDDATLTQPDEQPITDPVAEYFQLLAAQKSFREELSDVRKQHPDYEEMTKISDQAKALRTKIKNDEEVMRLSQKIETVAERMKLIKEIIRMNLVQTGEDKVEYEGRVLKLVQVLKEVKPQDEKDQNRYDDVE